MRIMTQEKERIEDSSMRRKKWLKPEGWRTEKNNTEGMERVECEEKIYSN